jgi:radical SAM protein with 4Fe4S-binding SPASM domain
VAPGGAVFRCWNEVAQPPATARAHLAADGALTPGAEDAWAAYDPFTHAPCRTCRAQPLCRGGCPWESRKAGDDEPGNCVTERFVLADRLRLHHLERTLHRGVGAAVEVGCS